MPPRTGFTADLKADDFAALCELVRTLCGVDLLPVQARPDGAPRAHLGPSAAARPDLAEYGARLRKDPEELDAFLDRVTINVSHLWRHEDQFEALRTQILPELAERGRVPIWSAGCSYGAEAYTLAAICRESIPERRAWRSTAPTSTSAWSPAPARASSRAEDARTAAAALAEAPVRAASPTAAGRPSPS